MAVHRRGGGPPPDRPDEPRPRRERKLGFVHYTHRDYGVPPSEWDAWITSQPYPITEENQLQPSMALVRIGSVQWPTDSVTSQGQVVAITTSMAWTPLDVDYIQDGQTSAEFYESLTGEGEVTGIRVNSIFDPLDIDYIQAGQTSVEFHEDLTGEGEVIGITVASIYEPVDVNYKQAGQNDSDFVEALVGNGEVTGIRTVNTL